MAKHATGAVVEHTRSDLDDLDTQIIALISRRIRVSKHVQLSKEQSGLPRVDLQREAEIRDRYLSAFGWHGAEISGSILAICRGN